MIISLTSVDRPNMQELAATGDLHVNTDNILYYKRSHDATIVYLSTLQTPLSVKEMPSVIDQLMEGYKPHQVVHKEDEHPYGVSQFVCPTTGKACTDTCVGSMCNMENKDHPQHPLYIEALKRYNKERHR